MPLRASGLLRLPSMVRTYATSATGRAVRLQFEHYPASSSSSSAIVVCHGLFGSKQNWRSLGRAMSSRFQRPVYALDLRNHGESPHIDNLAYQDMALDVIRFFEHHDLRDVTLIGHSLGGKVCMSVALYERLDNRISRLVSVDMSAKRGPLSPEFERYIHAMLEVEQKGCKTRAEADEILKTVEPDLGVRQFLLTNLTRNPSDAPTWSWRIPVASIQKNITEIGDFPYDAPGMQEGRPERSWHGETLFIKGTKSKYVNRKNIPTNQAYFPNAKLVTMETGHWCQAEKPNEFVKVIEDFINGTTRDETAAALQPKSKI